MIDGIATVTSKLVEVALDGLAMQQRVIANNIANANSAGYAAQKIDFEAALQAAASDRIDASAADMKAHLQNFDAALTAGDFIKPAGNSSVQLDVEMANLNQTVLKYQALIQGLNQYGSLTAMAISGDGSR